MKIYNVATDITNYKWLLPEVDESQILELNTFDCTPRFHRWVPPKVIEYDEERKGGDFAYYHPAVLLAAPNAAMKVRHFFERAGELLPLWFDGDQYTLLNVTECVNALNDEKTDWLRAPDGSKVEIRRHSFNPSKLSDSSLFKIPETCRGSVLTWEKDASPESEFKAFVEVNGLTGLLFDLLWDSEVDSC